MHLCNNVGLMKCYSCWMHVHFSWVHVYGNIYKRRQGQDQWRQTLWNSSHDVANHTNLAWAVSWHTAKYRTMKAWGIWASELHLGTFISFHSITLFPFKIFQVTMEIKKYFRKECRIQQGSTFYPTIKNMTDFSLLKMIEDTLKERKT